ncbi:MAG: GNAT family N-acetyltransferase [Pseudomonadota bacterium]
MTPPDETGIREATPADVEAILALMPRLAEFELPPGRDRRDLWRHDAVLLRQWARGEAEHCLVHVATASGDVVGVIMTTLRDELLSGEPSAHLEAIAVAAGAEGRGIAGRLIAVSETAAAARGARSMTLHVFRLNRRARALYERLGYDEELLRCSKALEP